VEWVNRQPDRRNICVAFAGGVAEINDPESLGLEEDTDGQIAGSFLSCEKSRAPIFDVLLDTFNLPEDIGMEVRIGGRRGIADNRDSTHCTMKVGGEWWRVKCTHLRHLVGRVNNHFGLGNKGKG
jgi:hypothetical protein